MPRCPILSTSGLGGWGGGDLKPSPISNTSSTVVGLSLNPLQSHVELLSELVAAPFVSIHFQRLGRSDGPAPSSGGGSYCVGLRKRHVSRHWGRGGGPSHQQEAPLEGRSGEQMIAHEAGRGMGHIE